MEVIQIHAQDKKKKKPSAVQSLWDYLEAYYKNKPREMDLSSDGLKRLQPAWNGPSIILILFRYPSQNILEWLGFQVVCNKLQRPEQTTTTPAQVRIFQDALKLKFRHGSGEFSGSIK